jgi:hypothetical protein
MIHTCYDRMWINVEKSVVKAYMNDIYCFKT